MRTRNRTQSFIKLMASAAWPRSLKVKARFLILVSVYGSTSLPSMAGTLVELFNSRADDTGPSFEEHLQLHRVPYHGSRWLALAEMPFIVSEQRNTTSRVP
jgi:hypothetical protein